MEIDKDLIEKLKNENTNFLEKKWIPLFLSKAVNNPIFRKDLDEAYTNESIKNSDINVTWEGNSFIEIGSIEKVLINFSEAVQTQIKIKRKELFDSINNHERMNVEKEKIRTLVKNSKENFKKTMKEFGKYNK